MKGCIAFVVLLAGCHSGPSLPSYGVVSDFQLVDQSGREFRSREQLDGKVWIANFIFTTCAGPCPRMTGELRALRDATGKLSDLRLVSFTIDPKRDTPEALSQYGRSFGADPDRWFFLTGAQSDLHNLSLKTFKLGPVDGTLEHSTRFVLVDRKGRIRGYYHSNDKESLAQLLKDTRTLAGEQA